MRLSSLATILMALAWATTAPLASAQAGLQPGHLPKSTVFYVAWHGMPAGEARKANSLFALWDDPDFAPVRAAMLEELLKSSAEQEKAQTPLTKEEMAEVASLLDNEFVAGYIGDPNRVRVAATGESQTGKWNGMFLVYDRTGKEATLAKLMLRARMSEKDPPKISTETLAGIPVIKMERNGGTSYWAENGKYALSASEPAVFEQITAWTKHATAEAAELSQSAAYKEASDLLTGGVLELFFHFPSVKQMAGDSSVAGFRIRPLLQNVRVDAVHLMAGHLSLEGSRTRIQGAILGDTAPGTPFDIWDAGTAAPGSLAYLSPNVVSLQESRINFLGIYDLLKRALRSTVPASQQSPADFVEGAAKKRLGMTIPEALASFTGEFTSLQSSAALDPAKRVFVVGIQRKAETLKLLRAALADRIAAERSEGDITFLKISEGGMRSSAGTASWKYYHLAVTGDAIVISSRLDSVRETLDAKKNGDALLPPAWQAARTQFPKMINGLSFVDFQKVDWAAVKERWKAESLKAAPERVKSGEAPRALEHTMDLLDPQIFRRHLHQTASASWKDAQGMHIDGWID